MLRLQAESRVLLIFHAVTAGERSIQEVARIELHARLRGLDRQLAPAHGIGDDRPPARSVPGLPFTTQLWS